MKDPLPVKVAFHQGLVSLSGCPLGMNRWIALCTARRMKLAPCQSASLDENQGSSGVCWSQDGFLMRHSGHAVLVVAVEVAFAVAAAGSGCGCRGRGCGGRGRGGGGSWFLVVFQ